MKIPPPLVSVIVPTRNSAAFLDACLGSIRNQTYKNIELIIVDNNSTDITKDVARKYTDKVFDHGPERSAQVNFGVQQASGEYVYKVDSDFVLEEGVVEQCVKKALDGYDAVVVHNTPDETVGWIARIRKFEVDMYKYDLTHSSARFVKKDMYRQIGGFDETITAGEDYDFQNRLNAVGCRTGFVDAEALHLGEPTSFLKHMHKYYLYGRDFIHYAKNNKSASRTQLSFVRPVYVKNWRKLLRHPLTSVLFISYNVAKFASGGLGYASGKLQQGRNKAT